MTKLLEQAVAKIRALPDEDQDDAAELLFALAARGGEPVQLEEETRSAVQEGQNQARSGQFASDAEIAELFKRYGA